MRRDVARRVFRGREFAAVSAQARVALGDDAVVLGTRTLRGGADPLVELLAAAADDVQRFERRATPVPLERALPERAPRTEERIGALASLLGARPAATGWRPYVVALVGPTGAGKTTSAVKLALNPGAFGTRRVGLVTLDTYRAGAVAQLETYAEVARLPLEVAYAAADVPGALARLSRCDVVIVDTPGRSPRTSDDDAPWRALLAALAPDEVHVVVPATMRPDLAEGMRDRFDAVLAPEATHATNPPNDSGAPDAAPTPAAGAGRVTHALLTKLDEVPEEDGVADLAARLALPVRWVADGQEIPADLAAGVPRLLAALGSFAGVMTLTIDRPDGGTPRRDEPTGTRATA